jgi:hypothetical protein
MSVPPERALSPTIWLVVAPPLLAFAWQIARGLRGRGAAYDPWPRRLGLGSIAASGAALLAHEVMLARAWSLARAVRPTGLLAPGVGGAHFETIDFGFGLLFDRLAVLACTIACGVAFAAAATMAARGLDDRQWKAWAWLELALGGALLSFLAGTLATTWLGWTLITVSSAWLAGWQDRKTGGIRGVRGALAVFALLVGDASMSGGLDAAGSAMPLAGLIAFLVASAAISVSPPRAGTPPVLAAVECGATTGLVGPFFLVRAGASSAVFDQGSGALFTAPYAAALVVATGAALLVFTARRARLFPAGLPRWVAIAGGAPPGLALVALGTDGARGGALVLSVAGVVAALVVAKAGEAGDPAAWLPQPSLERALLAHAPESVATLLQAFERWVVDSISASVGVVVQAAAWALAQFDAQTLGAPANAVAGRIVRRSRRLEPVMGGSLSSVVWAAVGAAAFAALVHALWPVR